MSWSRLTLMDAGSEADARFARVEPCPGDLRGAQPDRGRLLGHLDDGVLAGVERRLEAIPLGLRDGGGDAAAADESEIETVVLVLRQLPAPSVPRARRGSPWPPRDG